MLTKAMIEELALLEQQNGQLRTDDIVEKAIDPESALHKYTGFKWDLTEAAAEHWRAVARSIVRVYVGIIPRGDGTNAVGRLFVSVKPVDGDRAYLRTVSVLEARENRAQLINRILDRLTAEIRSYPLCEFDEVLRAIEQVRAELDEQPAKPSRRSRRGRGESRPHA